MIDGLSDMVAILLSTASAVVTAAIPIVVPALLKRWNVANDADLTQKLENALQAGAGEAYQYAASKTGTLATGEGRGLQDANTHNAALSLGTAYVTQAMPGVLQTLNISPDDVRRKVSARLGVLLAHDPSVTAGLPSNGPLAPRAITGTG